MPSFVAWLLLSSVEPIGDLEDAGNDRDDQGNEGKKFKEGSHEVLY